MDVRCENCGTEYEFDLNRVGPQGVTVKCTHCGNVFKVHRPDRRRRVMRGASSIGAGPQGREWLVRRPDRQMVAFRELTTLQKWIVEGRIGREDEISKNGETWKRLGNIMELEPFFSVYEKAQTLNRMIDQGANIAPVPTRGSDVFPSFKSAHSSVAPASSISQPAMSVPTLSPDSRPTSSLSHKSISAPIQPTLPPPVPPPTRQSSAVSDGSAASRNSFDPAEPRPAAGASFAPSVASSFEEAATHTNGAGDTEAPPIPSTHPVAVRSRVADARPVHERHFAGANFGSTASLLNAGPDGDDALPGPGALDYELPPAAFGTRSLDIPDQVMGNEDIVADFRRTRSRHRWLVAVALLLFLGAGAAAAVAAYGPQDNPLSALAVEYGIRRAPKPGADFRPQLEESLAALDRDTEDSRTRALALLAALYAEHPDDPEVAPWRPFVAATIARGHQRALADHEERQDPNAERTAATQRARSKRLVDQANDWLRGVQKAAPDRREVRLAEAAIALAEAEPDAAREALQIVAATHPEHRADPVWLHLSAEATAISPDASREALIQAQKRLRTAVAARPEMIRARVLLARIAHRRDHMEEARTLIDGVLEDVPEHEEAQRLKGAWAPPPPPPPPAKVRKQRPRRTRTYEQWLAVGDSLRQRDRPEQALDAYDAAARLSPEAVGPEVGKGWCLLDLDQPEVALVTFTKANEKAPDNPETYYGLAETYRMLDRAPEAVAAYKEYLKRAPAETPERVAVERQIALLEE